MFWRVWASALGLLCSLIVVPSADATPASILAVQRQVAQEMTSGVGADAVYDGVGANVIF